VEAARNAEVVAAPQRHHVSTCNTLTKYPNRPHWPVAGRGYSKAGTNEAPTGRRLTATANTTIPIRRRLGIHPIGEFIGVAK
jgi:hypothetical protein